MTGERVSQNRLDGSAEPVQITRRFWRSTCDSFWSQIRIARLMERADHWVYKSKLAALPHNIRRGYVPVSHTPTRELSDQPNQRLNNLGALSSCANSTAFEIVFKRIRDKGP